MNERIDEYIHMCPHCKGKMNRFFRGNFRGKYFNNTLGTFSPRCFCTEKCYENYKNKFITEIYDDNPIYCVEIDGEKRYMPYFEASYYFTDSEECKKIMDMSKCIGEMEYYGV